VTFGMAAAKQALEFVFYHEIAHVAEGHLDWIHKRSQTEKDFHVDTLTGQAMEFHADMQAFRFVTTYADEGTCRQLGMGLSLLFAILRKLDPIDAHVTGTHPHPVSRARLALAAARSVSSQKAEWVQDAFEQTQYALCFLGVSTPEYVSIINETCVVENGWAIAIKEPELTVAESLEKAQRTIQSKANEQLVRIENRLLELEPEFTMPFHAQADKRISDTLFD
jgi:hypothetical protein